MKKFIEEYGLIIVVICCILLFLSFGTGGFSKKVTGSLSDTTDKMTALTTKAANSIDGKSTLMSKSQFQNTFEATEKNQVTQIVFSDKVLDGWVANCSDEEYEHALKEYITGLGLPFPETDEDFSVLSENTQKQLQQAAEEFSEMSLTDISESQDGGVVMRLDNGVLTVSTRRSGVTVELPENCESLFSGFTNVRTIDLANVDSSNVTNMSFMFSAGTNGYPFDLCSNWGTEVQASSGALLKNLSTIKNLRNLDTSSAITMAGMFYGTSVSSLDLSNFDTSQVICMYAMFYNCSSLSSINLSSFDTHNVGGFAAMFGGCSSLQKLDLSSFETSQVVTYNNMFVDCTNLEQILVSSKWQVNENNILGDSTSSHGAAGIFTGCSKLPNYSSAMDKVTQTQAQLSHAVPSTQGGCLTLVD